MKIYLIIQFEKLHRYVFDYWYQSTNEDWGSYTPYKKANRNNKLRRFNKPIAWFYNLICPIFNGWRDQLLNEFPNNPKYKRYE